MTALVGFPELRLWPQGNAPTFGSFSLNQATDQLEYIFQVPVDMTITRGGFRQATVTGTAPTYILSLQGVDGSGNPDGTVKGGGSPASVTFTPTAGTNNAFAWKTFANSYAAARAEWLALVIAYSSGTIDVSNLAAFSSSAAFGLSPGQPYVTQNDNGSRTRQSANPVFGFSTSTTAYGYPVYSVGNSAFSSASTPDEKAILFNIPTTFCSTYKVCGAVLYSTLAAAGAFDLKLYDTNGTTVLQQTSYDTDQDEAAASSRNRPFYFDDAPSTLNAGSTYRLSFLPTTGSLTLPSLSVASSADMDAFPYGASWATSSTRTDAGSWTDDNLTRFGINLILSDITAPSGGGMLINGGMLGGLRG